VPIVARKLHTLMQVGLGYIRLGQSATTLSGGEAQRVKLALELSKRDTGRTLYILDEPTTGLHFHDIEMLLTVLHRLRDHGNTVVVIEHNLDVIKTADWLIDIGPEGGDGGGTVVGTGTPEAIAANPASHTGQYSATWTKPPSTASSASSSTTATAAPSPPAATAIWPPSPGLPTTTAPAAGPAPRPSKPSPSPPSKGAPPVAR
jgi:excinuclease ABC subunit A